MFLGHHKLFSGFVCFVSRGCSDVEVEDIIHLSYMHNIKVYVGSRSVGGKLNKNVGIMCKEEEIILPCLCGTKCKVLMMKGSAKEEQKEQA